MMLATVFRHTHRVVYSECTVGNHVYFSRYLDILEEARNEFFRAAGCSLLSLQDTGIAFPVVGVEVSYKSMARYDDLLTVELRVSQLTGVRLNFRFRILHQHGETLVEGEMRTVCAGENEKPRRIPTDLVERLRPFLDEQSQNKAVEVS